MTVAKGAPDLTTFAVPSALATTVAAVAFAHEHIRAIVVVLLVQSTLQLLPALFLLFGSPMVVMFADSLGKSGNPIAERNKFLAFAMTSAAVILAALSFLITSLLGMYTGWNVLGRSEGAAQVISTLVRHSHPPPAAYECAPKNMDGTPSSHPSPQIRHGHAWAHLGLAPWWRPGFGDTIPLAAHA